VVFGATVVGVAGFTVLGVVEWVVGGGAVVVVADVVVVDEEVVVGSVGVVVDAGPGADVGGWVVDATVGSHTLSPSESGQHTPPTCELGRSHAGAAERHPKKTTTVANRRACALAT
jgi:hypothetical protein